GHRYKLTAAIRRGPQAGDKLVRLRAVAFNGTLPGSHAEAGSQVAIMGLSGSIRSTNWTRIALASWRANKDFSSIALNVENPSTDLVVAELDEICVTELSPNEPCDDCQEAPVDAQGN